MNKKHLLFLVLPLGVVLGLTRCTSFQKNSERHVASVFNQSSLENDERRFLIGLGFEDFAGRAKRSLQLIESKKMESNEIAPAILEENEDRFKMITAARELAILFRLSLDQAEKNKTLPETLDRLTRLSAYHLMPFALVGLEAFPASVYKSKRGEAGRAERDAYLVKRTVRRHELEVAALNTALIEGLFSKEQMNSKENSDKIKSISDLVNAAVNYQYEFSGLQQSRFLGRALVATLLRYTRKNNLTQYEQNLSKMLSDEGQFLSNHISSTLSFTNRQNQVSSVKVYNGDFAHEFSTGPEAYQITVGVRPRTADQTKLAENLNLISNSLHLPAMIMNPLIDYAQKRKKENYVLSDDHERALAQVWDENLVRGFSHAGIAEVKSDAETKIEMVWIWDIYPYGNVGGTRVQTPENFAYAERYNRIGFVHYNPEKLLKHFQTEYQKNGYKKNVWESFGAKLQMDADDEPEVILNRNVRVQRKNYLEQSTAEKWMSYKPEDAQAWFTNEVAPRAFEMARRYLTGSEAMVFSQGFKNRESSAYCTQFILLAYLQGAQLDMQTKPDDWFGLVKMMSRLGIGDYEVNDRIVSPSGFAWQTDLVENVYIVNLNRLGVLEQESNHPQLNKQPTVIDRRLALIGDLSKVKIAGTSADLDPEEIDTDDDDL